MYHGTSSSLSRSHPTPVRPIVQVTILTSSYLNSRVFIAHHQVLMPAAAPALTVQLQRQVWVSPSMMLVLELLEASSKQLQCKRSIECSVGDILVGVPNEQNGRACYHLIPSNQKGRVTYKHAMVDQAIRMCSNRHQALLYLRQHVAGAGAIILPDSGTWCEKQYSSCKKDHICRGYTICLVSNCAA